MDDVMLDVTAGQPDADKHNTNLEADLSLSINTVASRLLSRYTFRLLSIIFV